MIDRFRLKGPWDLLWVGTQRMLRNAQVSQNEIEDHTEDVIIPDLKTVLKQFELIALYCENTGLFQHVEALRNVKLKIDEHLMFE